MPRQPSLQGLGDRELQLLRWVAEHGEVTVGEAAESFGGAAGLARTTVQTMLERLHDKGYLRRSREGGVFRYASPLATAELLRGLVASFVEGPLAGSLSPFVAYLAQRREVSDEDLAELRRLVDRLRGPEEDG
ncbi:MAG TPA: BlaI/MecI/CopY family transcriptional regulator [Thermoanaerobaculia bacterium]|nr:BlaI/MecI/CopY family transcriptional regulator [Thermoanaerobaculia bacterium]